MLFETGHKILATLDQLLSHRNKENTDMRFPKSIKKANEPQCHFKSGVCVLGHLVLKKPSKLAFINFKKIFLKYIFIKR